MQNDPFSEAGELAEAYRAVDWARTSVGPVAGWPPVLLESLRLLHDNRFPMSLFWGPDLLLLYNAAFVPLIADKHPGAIGTPASVVFEEAFEQIGPLMTHVMEGRGALWVEDTLVPLERHGFLEDCYFTFAYSPVRDRDGGEVLGVIDIATETTRQVLAIRRLEALRAIGGALVEVDTYDAVEPAARRSLAAFADVGEVRVRRRLGAPPLARLETGERDGTPTASVPLAARSPGPSSSAVLELDLNPGLPVDGAYRDFLLLVGDIVSRTLTRLDVQAIDSRVAAAERLLSESLQRSLLTRPTVPAGLGVAVRYLPAADQAQVGGDWYDAFLMPDGSTVAVIGDVAGHDSAAAAVMAQTRNLLRGIAIAGGGSPAAVLRQLDEALVGLDVAALATVVLARLDAPAADGSVLVAWSNAGHPPPAVLATDGTARHLGTPPNPLLGLDATVARDDHRVRLAAGETLVLYTDGLVERRRWSLDDGFAWLSATLAASTGEPIEDLCDRLVDEMPPDAEDDVALLLVRPAAVGAVS